MQIQLIRIELRVPEYGWTTQKVFHLMNFVVNGGTDSGRANRPAPVYLEISFECKSFLFQFVQLSLDFTNKCFSSILRYVIFS